jgi:glutathione synthase/RimK-type ligase-like ATP-grasp enzyme
VWWRRPQAFILPPQVKDPGHQRFALSEATTAFQGLYQSLEVTWINQPGRDSAANHKPWQLTVAQRIGLTIPDTLMTSDPDAAREFWQRHSGAVIYKQFIALPDLWRETRRLRPNEEEFVEHIRIAPVIFQRYVDAVADIRVIIIGDTIFAAAADVRGADYPDDVRMNLNATYAPHQLPKSVRQHLFALMGAMGLTYGAADLRLTSEGEYVFLEINPAGQFLYIELATGQPIAAALARELTARTDEAC